MSGFRERDGYGFENIENNKNNTNRIAERANVHTQGPALNHTVVQIPDIQPAPVLHPATLDGQNVVYVYRERPIDKKEIKKAMREYEQEKACKSCLILIPVIIILFIVMMLGSSKKVFVH